MVRARRQRPCNRSAVGGPFHGLQLILDTPTRIYGASLRSMRAISRVPFV